MSTNPVIVWKGMTTSPALEAHIRDEVAQLDALDRRITSCRVVIEQPSHHHRHGGHFVVKVELSVPGHVLAATRDPTEHPNAEDPYAAVNEAFSRARRQLEAHAR